MGARLPLLRTRAAFLGPACRIRPVSPNRVFFPSGALDEWVHADRIDLSATEFSIRAEGRRYRIIEAARVLAEVTGGEDVYDIVGKVKTVNFLHELGAELLGSSMIIGDLAFDVVPGFIGSPVGSFSGHLEDPGRSAVLARGEELQLRDKPQSDEELLAQLLMRTLE